MKWPVVVPSPLSCSVNEHLSWAACSSVRTSSFSWASTTRLVGFDGLDRAAGDAAELVGAETGGLLHQVGFDELALLIADPTRQLTGGVHDHRRVPGGDQAGVERCGGGVVPDSSSVASATSRAALEPDTVVVFATQAPVPVNPASLAVPARSAAATSFSLSASMRRVARSTSATTPACSPDQRLRCAGVHPVQHPVHLGHPGEHRVAGVGVEVEEC